MWKFLGSIKKEVEFSGVSMDLAFLPWNFHGESHNFAEFLGVKAYFLQNF